MYYTGFVRTSYCVELFINHSSAFVKTIAWLVYHNMIFRKKKKSNGPVAMHNFVLEQVTLFVVRRRFDFRDVQNVTISFVLFVSRRVVVGRIEREIVVSRSTGNRSYYNIIAKQQFGNNTV